MRTFLIFLALFALAALISGLLTYPAWALVHMFADVPIHRVMHRVGMLIVAVAMIYFMRRWNLATRESLGYAMPGRVFIKQMAIGFAAGVTLMMPLVAALFGLSIRSFNDETAASTFAKLIAQGLLTGWAVAFIEETLFRGAMFSAVRRESGTLLAVLLPTLVYAAAHFIAGDLRIPNDQVTTNSGMQLVVHMFDAFASPLRLLDSLVALYALGLLLSCLRIRTGAIGAGIGLHAGGVSVIVILRNTSHINDVASLHWLVGSYDGVIGWMAAIWISIVAIVYWRISRPATAN